jgi:3-carboxy-cis,cis-muconate cycloisomerase
LTSFAPIFVPAALREAVSDASWFAAMLDAERALARAEASAGAIPQDAAAVIEECCKAARFDLAALSAAGRAVGNPAEPLVRALRRQAGDAAPYVHFGATSQDVVDTAAMLITRKAVALIAEELAGAAAAAAQLCSEHRSTPLAARTLLQQAVPTTFGAKAAGWLVGLVDARTALLGVTLHAQLGGAAGTLAPLGDQGVEVLGAFAYDLGLAEPVVPWHARRTQLATVGGALQLVASGCDKIGLDLVLLAQTEVGEVSEAAGGGGSSTMPHKRNPVNAVLARACARLVHANAAVLIAGEHEHERAAGAWQAEWTALSEALAHAGGAAAAARTALTGLEVQPDRMRANMTEDLYSERDRLGLQDAEYLGSAARFVDRALDHWREAS